MEQIQIPDDYRLPLRVIHKVGNVSVEKIYEEDRISKVTVKETDTLILSVPDDQFHLLMTEPAEGLQAYLSLIKSAAGVKTICVIPRSWQINIVTNEVAEMLRKAPLRIIERPSE